MPNWSYNTLEITGPTEDINRFLEAVTATRADNEIQECGYSLLRTFIPRPDAVVENGTWYDWSLTHWGTKWEDDMRLRYADANRLRFTGETAWAPPTNGYQTVSAQWPTLTFWLDYSEESGQFVGAVQYHNGEEIALREYSDQDPEFPDYDGDDTERYDEQVQELVLQCRTEVGWP